jgi:heme/copper-type cytochrome/quinol oxidase subunit 1
MITRSSGNIRVAAKQPRPVIWTILTPLSSKSFMNVPFLRFFETSLDAIGLGTYKVSMNILIVVVGPRSTAGG